MKLKPKQILCFVLCQSDKCHCQCQEVSIIWNCHCQSKINNFFLPPWASGSGNPGKSAHCICLINSSTRGASSVHPAATLFVAIPLYDKETSRHHRFVEVWNTMCGPQKRSSSFYYSFLLICKKSCHSDGGLSQTNEPLSRKNTDFRYIFVFNSFQYRGIVKHSAH